MFMFTVVFLIPITRNTVKPVLRGHLWDEEKVTLYVIFYPMALKLIQMSFTV